MLHILIGTYELLNFRNLSGQASRRGLDIHFPRYLYQNEQDRLDFQAALLALLKQVPLNTDIPELMQRWLYFYEHSIGCVGVLKDWLIRTVAAALHDGNDTLTLKQLHEHTLTLAQCERMALDATEGEQKLSYMESRREHLWHLLQIGMGSTDVPTSAVDPETPFHREQATSPQTEVAPKTKRTRKKPTAPTPLEITTTTPPQIPIEPAPKKKQTRKKTTSTATVEITETPRSNSSTDNNTITQDTLEQTDSSSSTKKKSGTRVGQRKPKRDPVGDESQSGAT